MIIKKFSIFQNTYILYFDKIDSAIHKHYAIQIIIGIDNDFELTTNGITSQCNSAVLLPWVEHQLKGEGKYLVLFVNPISDLGLGLMSEFKNGSTRIKEISQYKLLFEQIPIAENLHEISKSFVQTLNVQYAVSESYFSNEIIHKAILKLRNRNKGDLQIKELASDLNISSSRFLSLFKEHVNLSPKKILDWNRLSEATKEILFHNASFHDIVYEYNFTDVAHLSNTFKKCFGLSLRSLRKVIIYK